MNAWVDTEEWKAGLPGWGIRGTLLSIPSWMWAVASNYRHPLELGAMLAGTVVWVLVATTGCSLKMARATEPRRRWLEALHRAAWVKIAWVGFGAPAASALGALKISSGWVITAGGGVLADLLTGKMTTETVHHWSQWAGYQGTASADSFSGTLVTTLLQGMAVAGGLIPIAFTLRGLSWLKAQFASSRPAQEMSNQP